MSDAEEVAREMALIFMDAMDREGCTEAEREVLVSLLERAAQRLKRRKLALCSQSDKSDDGWP